MNTSRDAVARPAARTEPLSRGETAGSAASIRSRSESPRFPSHPASAPERSVELHIEELVLHGVARGDPNGIGDAVERELTRLFVERGAPIEVTENVQIAHLDCGAVEIKTGSNAETIGKQLVKAIYGGLRNEYSNTD